VDRPGGRPDDHDPVHAELRREPADLLVPGPLMVAELGEVTEHGDASPPRPDRRQRV